MRAFQTALKPSHMIQSLVIILHLGAAIMCTVLFYGWLTYIGLIGLGASAVYAWKRACLKNKDAIHQIMVNRLGQATILIKQNNIAYEAKLGVSSMVLPRILFLQWELDSRMIWQAVLPDMMSVDDFRRLKVWARWCQPTHH